MKGGPKRAPSRVLLSLAAGAVFMAACSLSPLGLFNSDEATPQPAIELMRCHDVKDVLCLVTFGLEPPDEMLILLLAVPGLPQELEIAVTRKDEKLLFECVSPPESPTDVYCTGPQIPLGTTVLIEVFAAQEQVLLASGKFTLTAFALPTVQAGGVELPTPVASLTPRGTRTPLPSATVPPGTAYPNLPPELPPISPP